MAEDEIGIQMPHTVDLAWALIVTAFGLYLCIRLEEPLDVMELRPALKVTIILTFAAALITYTGFSFQVPDNFFLAPD